MGKAYIRNRNFFDYGAVLDSYAKSMGLSSQSLPMTKHVEFLYLFIRS